MQDDVLTEVELIKLIARWRLFKLHLWLKINPFARFPDAG